MDEKIEVQNNAGMSENEAVERESKMETSLVEQPKTFWSRYKAKIILAGITVIVLAVMGIVFHMTRAEYVACKYAEAIILGDQITEAKYSAVNLEEELIYLFAMNECYDNYKDDGSRYRSKDQSFDEYFDENRSKYDEFEFYAEKSEEYDEDIENWKQFCKAYERERSYTLEEKFGEFKISAEKRSDKIVRPSSFDEFDVELFEEMGIDWENVGKIMGVTVRVKVEGDYDRASYTRVVNLIRDGICWKVLSSESVD